MKTKIANTNVNIVLFSFVTVFMMACQQDENFEQMEESSYAIMYADSAYLEIEGNLYDPEVIWGNVETYIPAFNRMQSHLKFKDGRLSWEFGSASDLKISENIYNYVIRKWENKNKLLESGTCELAFTKEGNYVIKPINREKYKGVSRGGGRYELYIGMDSRNMSYLKEIYENYGPDGNTPFTNLNNVIDIEHSDFRGNGMGDMSIDGTGTTNKKFWGYYCCNACGYDKTDRYSCYYNEMNGWDNRKEGGILYEMIDGPQQLPLITLRNRHNFN
ncbi:MULTISPECIES: hypothetical protein [Sanguibacteroides]|uniref:Uncharacterized protein n=1 Tax=Sanguibacteroides justesenii TaxID=1547597 RepID=A0A0C3R4W3_9PORP|nr:MULTISPECIES: hypothetical protein [Sanguibacteroides]KIO44585.1 hypothetical protein BA92_10405 [Sanguibacteroides justesenii]